MTISSLESSFVIASSTGSVVSLRERASLRCGCAEREDVADMEAFRGAVSMAVEASGWLCTGLRDLTLGFGLKDGWVGPGTSLFCSGPGGSEAGSWSCERWDSCFSDPSSFNPCVRGGCEPLESDSEGAIGDRGVANIKG